MNYELAKELKEAGFSQKMKSGDGFYELNSKDLLFAGDGDICGDDYVYTSGCGCCGGSYKIEIRVPTLSELIDATVSLVPDKFLDITSRDYRPEQWVATSSWEVKSGSTPEEAVARLWLALNKNA